MKLLLTKIKNKDVMKEALKYGFVLIDYSCSQGDLFNNNLNHFLENICKN